VLREVAQRVLWLSAAIVDAANAGRPNETGIKVGGHQASSSSMVDVMVALWFGRRTPGIGGTIIGELFPTAPPAPLVTVLDGHPHTLSFLAGARGDRIHCLGVTEFGQSSDLTDAYRLHHIDTGAITDAALTLLRR